MSSLPWTPPQSDEIRLAFEYAYAQNNHLLMTTIQTNRSIEQLQRDALAQGIHGIDGLKLRIEDIQQQLGEAAAQADERGEGSWNDYYRALSHAMFAEEMVLAPLYFSDRKYHTQRHQLTDGLYGMAGTLLEKALFEYDAPHTTKVQRGHLLGVITEQSVLSLINRQPKTGTFAALPASVTEDLSQKTDATYWCFDKKWQTQTYNIQVKSNMPPAENAAPDHGFIVTAMDFNNSNLKTSRAIVQELAGVPLDHITRHHLDQSERALKSYINHQIKERFAVTTLEQGKKHQHAIGRYTLSHEIKKSSR